MLGSAYYRSFGLPVITIRASNNYGPWQYPEKFVPVIILKTLHDERYLFTETAQMSENGSM